MGCFFFLFGMLVNFVFWFTCRYLCSDKKRVYDIQMKRCLDIIYRYNTALRMFDIIGIVGC